MNDNRLPAAGDAPGPLQTFDNRQTMVPAVPMGPSPAQQPDEDVINLREYLQILLRRKWTIILALTLAVIAGLLVTFNTTPIYRSKLLLQIERNTNQVVEYGDIIQEDGSSGTDKDFYATQYELLKSRTLARRVIDQLGLQLIEDKGEGQAGFLANLKAGAKGILSVMSGAQEPQERTGGVDPDVARAKKEEDLFIKNLSVEPVKNSRLVSIYFESTSPSEAITVANTIANSFINMNLERRYDASSYAKEFLEKQLVQMRANLEDAEKKFVSYARQREIVNLDNRQELVLNNLRQMNDELVTAEADRIAAEAEYLEMLDSAAGDTPEVLDSELVRTLKERRASLEAEYEQNLNIYKPSYPSMVRLKSQIDEVAADIKQEIGSIRQAVKSRYEAKVREEAELTKRIRELKDEALALQDRSTDFETLKREVETNRELYDGLLQRMKEVGVAAGVGENNISVVDAATVPLAPYKPSLQKNLAIAVAMGLFCGIALAFLVETLDDRVKSGEQTEKHVGAPVLGQLPMVSPSAHGIAASDISLLAFKDPKSPLAEAARSLRTTFMLSTAEGAPRVLHLTSAGAGEGKTTTATSLAITFAQAGKKVLLIDCDLRNPSLHRNFRLPNTDGLSSYLTGEVDPADIAQPTPVMRLFTITSGPLPPNPVELLSGPKMLDLLSLASERFDHVILDGPPVLGLADALVLAHIAKATVFVVEPGESRVRDIEAAARRLHQANARLLGVVLTKVGRPGTGYGYGYGYSYNYLYSYGGKGKSTALAEPEQA